jgi:putative aldouronate transport system substrate-binding protein
MIKGMNVLLKTNKAITVVSLTALLAAGCSAGEQQQKAEEKAPQVSPAVTQTESGKASPTPISLKIHMHYYNTNAFNEEWTVFKKAAELTNVTLKGTVPATATNSKEVFNLMLASNNLADIIHGDRVDMNKAGLQGALVPLDDLIKQHAPNLQKFLEKNDWVRKQTIAADGKLYVVPFVADGEASSGLFIRQDWLDKLKLPVPKTVDEYYKTLTAFRDQDPNGNGKKDEVPYFSRDKVGALKLAQLFGARTLWYEQDGAVRYGKFEPEYKTAITNIAKWYKEGLIDKEIFTRGAKAREVLLGDNTGGSTHDWIGSTASYNDTVKASVPGIQLLPILPPADVNGKIKEENSRPLLGAVGWGISATNKHQIESIKYFDFWFTEEGRRLNNFGLEGTHYTMKDGKPIFKDEVLKNTKAVLAQLKEAGAQMEIGFQQDFTYEEQWMNPIGKAGVREYLDKKVLLPLFPNLSFTESEQKVITQKWTAIQTFIAEKEQKWIMGAEEVEPNFDGYLKSLKDMGMDEIVKIYNDAYQRYLKS